MKDPERFAGLILMVGVLGNSTSGLFSRYSQIPSATLVTLRMVITVLLFCVLLLCTGQWKQLRQMNLRQLGWCALSGFVFAVHLVVSVEAIQNVSMAASNVLLCTEVIFVSLMGIPLGDRLDGRGWLLILTAFAGSVLVALGSGIGDVGRAPLYGCAMAVLGSILSAVYTLIGRQQRKSGLSTTCYTFIVYVCCAVSVVIIDLIGGTPVLAKEPREYGLALCMAVFCTFLGHSVFSYSLKFLSSAHVSAAKLLIPVMASLAAIPLFHEIPSLLTQAGCAIVLLAVLAITLRQARGSETKQQEEQTE